MIVVVSGYKRSGTSLMMEILHKCGFSPYYDKSFEERLKSSVPKKEYFYEDEKIVHEGFVKGEVPEGSCVKVFATALDNVPEECTVIYMYRLNHDIIESLSEHKSYDELKKEKEIIKDLSVWAGKLNRFDNRMFIDFNDLINEPEMVLRGGMFEKVIGKKVSDEALLCIKKN